MPFLGKKKTTTTTNKHILYLIGGIVVNFCVKSNEMNEAHIHTPPAKQKQTQNDFRVNGCSFWLKTLTWTEAMLSRCCYAAVLHCIRRFRIRYKSSIHRKCDEIFIKFVPAHDLYSSIVWIPCAYLFIPLTSMEGFLHQTTKPILCSANMAFFKVRKPDKSKLQSILWVFPIFALRISRLLSQCEKGTWHEVRSKI